MTYSMDYKKNLKTSDDGQAYLNKIGIYIVWGSFV